MTEAYIAEAMELNRYRAEMDKLKLKRQELERVAADLEKRARRQEGARGALQHLEGFCRQVAVGLDALSYEETTKCAATAGGAGHRG